MNKKGFTLVELLATITILSLVIVLTITAYSSVTDSIKNVRSSSLKALIEQKASDYAFDTGKTLIFVNELIEKGYIEEDKGGGIKDPKDDSEMKCRVVEMKKEGTHYNAKLKNDNFTNEDGTCNNTKLSYGSLTISVNGAASTSGNWYRGDSIVLKVSKTCNTSNTCIWESKSGAYQEGSNIYTIPYVKISKSTYTFTFITSGTRYQASKEVKIDNEAPFLYEKTSIEKQENGKNRVTINASDGDGSGIAGYAFLDSNPGDVIGCDSISSGNYKASNVNDYASTVTGTKYCCIKDKVNNFYLESFTLGS